MLFDIIQLILNNNNIQMEPINEIKNKESDISNNKKDELLIIPWIVNCKSVWKVFHSQIKSNNHGKSIVLDKYILSYFSIQLY